LKVSEPAPGAGGARRVSRYRHRGRLLFDRLETAVAESPLSARPALLAAAGIGRLRGALSRRWPSAAEVAAIYGTGPARSGRIALEIAGHEARNRLVVRRVHGRSLEPFAGLIRFPDEGRRNAVRLPLAPPCVLVTAHLGALYLLALALQRIATPRVVLRWSTVHLPFAGEEVAPTSGGVAPRTASLRRGLEALREDKFVITALEGPHGGGERGTLLGRPLDLGRGAFALAGATGAPVVPIAALWEGNQVVIEVGAPIRIEGSAPERERAVGAVALWFEGLLRRAPGQIGLGLLRRLLLGSDATPILSAD
jgi:hypothetical protein